MKDNNTNTLQELSEDAEEAAWRRYLASLTPEALEAMKRPARGDVRARLRNHIERLKTTRAKAS